MNRGGVENILRKGAMVGTLMGAAAVLHSDTVLRPFIRTGEAAIIIKLASLLAGCTNQVPTPATEIVSSEVPFSVINGFDYQKLSAADRLLIDSADDAYHKAEVEGKLDFFNSQGQKSTGGVRDLLTDIYNAQGSEITPEEIDSNVIQDIYEPVIYHFGDQEMTIKPVGLVSYDTEKQEPQLNYALFARVNDGEWGIIGVPTSSNPNVDFTPVIGGVVPTEENFSFIFNDDFPHMTPFAIVAGSSSNAPFTAGLSFGESVDKTVFTTNNRRLTTSIPGVPQGTPITDDNVRMASGKLFSLALPIATPEPIKTPLPQIVLVSEIFKDNQEFYSALSSQDKEASNNFSYDNGKTFLLIGDNKIEIDPLSGRVNFDVNGNPLLVEGTGYKNPITIHGVNESEGKVFAYNPEAKYQTIDPVTKKVTEIVIPGHWFEVIQTNHPVDINASAEEYQRQLEVAINDPITVSLEQVQNGDWAMSKLLSGYLKPFPEGWEYLGNALYHEANDSEFGNLTLLYTSKKIPIPLFGVTEVDGNKFGLRSFQIWNPTNRDNPNHNEVLTTDLGIGSERMTALANKNWLDLIFKPGLDPQLVISNPGDEVINYQQLGLVSMPSMNTVRQLVWNDPVRINFIGDVLFNKANVPEVVKNLWQWNYREQLPSIFQNLIWLYYF